MQNINNIVEEAKKKRSLSDLKPTSLPEGFNTINTEQPENHNNGKIVEPEQQKSHTSSKAALPENQNTIKKVKVTVYITEESWQDFNNVYGTRILNQRKTDKGDLMMEAIELLKQKEFTRKTEKQ